jgi:hypothetical protein
MSQAFAQSLSDLSDSSTPCSAQHGGEDFPRFGVTFLSLEILEFFGHALRNVEVGEGFGLNPLDIDLAHFSTPGGGCHVAIEPQNRDVEKSFNQFMFGFRDHPMFLKSLLRIADSGVH